MNKNELVSKLYHKIVKILEEDLSDSDMGKIFPYDEEEDNEYYTVDDLESEILLQLENYILGDETIH